ncbi:MAG TPA: SPOR domain-containing protein [Luteimonas sp.]|nr:SPOR domain-containing protein [Luteimonas sp.]
MLARALIILLVVLNLGVAAWWAARRVPAPQPVVEAQPAGVERLQLLREAAHAPASTPPPAAPSPAAPEATPAANGADATVAAAPEQCHAIGPFADAAAVEAARLRLQPRVARLHVREVVAPAARRDWRVWLPPLADRAAAQAMAGRIAAAGFEDYFIVAAGGEANSIALGRYRSEESARRREAALRAGGFAEVRAEPLGEAPPSQAWIDVATTTPLTAAERTALGGAGVEPLDCARVPGTSPAAPR